MADNGFGDCDYIVDKNLALHSSDETRSTSQSNGMALELRPYARRVVKRLIDIWLSISLLLLSSPVLITIAIVVAADGGPIFFSHSRIGRGGRSFRCLKFRTMVVDSDRRLTELLENDPASRTEWIETRKLRKDPRVTVVGHLLRNLSFDELPQLVNVIRGDMSLVGPRPVTHEELKAYYGETAERYCTVRPGITGAWQVSGRSSIDFACRVRLDESYVNHLSLRSDLLILLKTVRVVLLREGAW